MSDGYSPQEYAKLRMFVNYFERCKNKEPTGYLHIDRVTGVGLDEAAWRCSKQPLQPMTFAEKFKGFEDAPGLAHADFANMFLGGGVLSGGCVQEEIRFAICPELVVGLLVNPRMMDDEAIQIVGGEQFSAYKGYAFNLRYNG